MSDMRSCQLMLALAEQLGVQGSNLGPKSQEVMT